MSIGQFVSMFVIKIESGKFSKKTKNNQNKHIYRLFAVFFIFAF